MEDNLITTANASAEDVSPAIIEKKATFVNFVKEHKKEIAIGVGIACAVIVGVIIFKNKGAIEVFVKKTASNGLKSDSITIPISTETVSVSINPSPKYPVNVHEHLRNLPNGWKPSQCKVDWAMQNGIALEENQTLVRAYVKNAA